MRTRVFLLFLKTKTLILFIFYDKIFKKREKGAEMKSKKIKEEMIIDYVTKESIVKSDKNFRLKYVLALCALAGYTAHTFYFASIAAVDEVSPEMGAVFFFLLVFALSGIFMLIAHPLFSAKILSEQIEEAREFLNNAGREETKENVNLVLNFFYSNNEWQEIEDMPYNLFEDIEIVSGNMNRKKHFL